VLRSTCLLRCDVQIQPKLAKGGQGRRRRWGPALARCPDHSESGRQFTDSAERLTRRLRLRERVVETIQRPRHLSRRPGTASVL